MSDRYHLRCLIDDDLVPSPEEIVVGKLVLSARAAGIDLGRTAAHVTTMRPDLFERCVNVAETKVGEACLQMKQSGELSTENVNLFRSEFMRSYRDTLASAGCDEPEMAERKRVLQLTHH